MAEETIKNSTLLKTAALLAIGFFTVRIMIDTQFILLPLVWGVFIALLILPLTEMLEHFKLPRWLAIITVLLVVTVVVGFILYLLSVQVAGLLGDIPEVTSTLGAWSSDLQRLLETRFRISHELLTQQALSSISQIIQTGLTEVRNSLYSVFRLITVISVIPLYIFFMLYYRDQFYRGTLQLVGHHRQAQSIFNKIMKVVQQYLRGLVIVTLIVAVLFYIVLTVFKIKYAFFFAIFLALFNLIPYIGVFVSSVVVVLYSLATSDTLFYPLAILISLWLIQLFENNLITPYVVGSQVKLNPLVALIAIFAGASIWGVSGMILFIPIMGVMKVIFDEFEHLKPFGVLLGKP
jgi:predicted PurR-regulated permease PerM